MNSSLRIAILPQGGKQWIAGIIYTHNLIRAIHCLPEEERPELLFFMGPWDDPRHHRELGHLRPSAHYYCFRERTSDYDKLCNIKNSLLRLRWPSSLEGLAIKLRPKVLFPVQCSLGEGFPAPWIGWIPDFQHKHLPQFFSEEERQNRDKTYERLIKEAGHIVVSSQDAYQDLMRWFPRSEKKGSVLTFSSVATKEWYEGHPGQTIAAFRLPKKFLIFPSQFWIHKNHQTVFKALAILKNKSFCDIPIVCTGFTQDYRRPDHFASLSSLLEEKGLKKNVHILGLLPRVQQIQLMRASAAVIQPSLFEGWSSLVEDARTLGKPIFVSDIPIHREQKPPDAFFFSPENADQLADLLAREWKNLTPGPDIDKEKKANKEQHERAQAYARAFLLVVERAAQKDRAVDEIA